MSKKKPLIVFEGIEGTGKTTLINHVSSHLRKKNITEILPHKILIYFDGKIFKLEQN